MELLPLQDIARFCQKWQIVELSLFGSILRDDFNPESDIDVLVTFSDKSEWGLFDHVQMQQGLQALLKRKVDLISHRALEHTQNQLLRDEILKTAKVVFSRDEETYAER
jgi:predicted nucleotidyltransferase